MYHMPTKEIPISIHLIGQIADIGANLADSMFSGIYHGGSKKHEPDLPSVLERAWKSGLEKIIITGTSLEDSKKALMLANTHENLYCSVGCHPTNCKEIATLENPGAYISELADLIKTNRNKVVAVGEFGLDYDRLNFCPKEAQLQSFEAQLIALAPLEAPLFLHCRNASQDLFEILKRHKTLWEKKGGVVHSFDGSQQEAQQFIELGLHIGINGWNSLLFSVMYSSLKTEDNLKVVGSLDKERLLVETDSPWCEVRPTHAGARFIRTPFAYTAVKKEKWNIGSMVKGRNEPCTIRQIVEIIAGIRQDDPVELANTIYNNTTRIFFTTT